MQYIYLKNNSLLFERIWQRILQNAPQVIILIILITFPYDFVLLLLAENNWSWSL